MKIKFEIVTDHTHSKNANHIQIYTYLDIHLQYTHQLLTYYEYDSLDQLFVYYSINKLVDIGVQIQQIGDIFWVII